MASPVQSLAAFLFFSLLSFCHAQQGLFRPKALVLPVHRDLPTHLYVSDIHKRTPQLPIPFVVDLNGKFLWVNCQHQYLSSTYRAPRCHSTHCAMANTHVCHSCFAPAGPGCHNNTCELISINPVTNASAPGELAEDVLSIRSTQGSNPSTHVTVPRFLFACAPSSLLQGTIGLGQSGIQGFAGFGHTQIALPIQLASHFGFRHKFAMCLGGTGVIFFGDGPYILQPGLDISQSLTYTPLITNPKGEYFIQLSAIGIGGKKVPLSTNSLARNPGGTVGVKLSTVDPYSVLETNLFKSITHFLINQLSLQTVNPVAPFGLCFSTQSADRFRSRAGGIYMDFVLDKDNIVWRMFGESLFTQAGKNVMCFAFVEGGVNSRSPVVIGGHQMEDNLLQFDLAASRLGFSNSLLLKRTSCANFNFTHV